MIVQVAEWVGLLLAGGIGLGSILGAFKLGTPTIRTNIAYALGLGMLLNVLLGFFFLTLLHVANGLLSDAFYVIVALNLTALFAGLCFDRSFFKVKPSWEDAKFAIVPIVLSVMLYFYFYRFPIFPEFDSVDFHSNPQNAIATMQSGELGIGGAISYWGVFYLLALALRLDQADISLVVVRGAMAVLIVLSCFTVNLAASRLKVKNVDWSLWATVAYAGIGVWYSTVLDSGLYPNFYGLLSSLFIVAVTVDLFDSDTFGPRKVGVYALFLLSLTDLLFSHYSSFLVLPAILSYAVVKLRRNPTVSGFVIVSVVAPALFLFFGPYDLFAVFVGSQTVGNNPVIGSFTPLAKDLAGWPVLSYAASFFWNDIAAVPVLLSIPIFAYLIIKKRESKLLIPFVWLGTIFAFSPLNVAAWRFSLIADLAAGLMFSYVVALGLQRVRQSKAQSLRTYSPRSYRRIHFIPAMVVLALVVSSSGIAEVPSAFVGPSTADYRQAQLDVYSALKWFAANATCTVPVRQANGVIVKDKQGNELTFQGKGNQCSFVTPTSWQLACTQPCYLPYSQQLFGIQGSFSCSDLVSPANAENDAIAHRDTYLIIANETMVTCSAFPCPSPTHIEALNSTSGRSLAVKITGDGLAGGTEVALIVNGTFFGSVVLPDDNIAYATLHFAKPGIYEIQSYVGQSPSWKLWTAMGYQNVPTSSIPWSFTACLPWNWQPSDLSGSQIVYQNKNIKIWSLVTGQ